MRNKPEDRGDSKVKKQRFLAVILSVLMVLEMGIPVGASSDTMPRNASSIFIGEAASIGSNIILEQKAPKDIAKFYLSAKQCYDKVFKVLKLANAERKKVGRAPLKMDKNLLAGAMQRAAEIAIHYKHIRPNGSQYYTVAAQPIGENIAIGGNTGADVMKLWMDSAGHRDNILTSAYKSIGVGCVKIDGIFYWVQLFGTNQATQVTESSYSNKTVEAKVDIDTNANWYKPVLESSSSNISKIKDTKTVKYYCKNHWVGEYYGKTPILPKSLTFTSSDKSVCSVNEKGVVTALKGGKATISAYPKGKSAKKVSWAFTVGTPRKITFNGNGGKSDKASKQIYYVGATTTYGTLPKAERIGHGFKGWYTAKTGGTKVTAKTNITASKDITLYAQWTANKYTIKYDRNGGTGSMANTTVTYGVSQKLRANTFNKDKAKFQGWSAYRTSDKKWKYTKGDKSGWYVEGKAPSGYVKTVYKDKGGLSTTTSVNGDIIVMYAKWVKK